MADVEFAEAVSQVGDAIDAVGDEVDDVEYLQDEPTQISTYRVSRAGWSYDVIGNPENNIFTIRFPFSIAGNVASVLGPEEISNITGKEVSSEEEITNELNLEAGIGVMNLMSEQNAEEFRYHLLQEICNENTGFTLETTDQGKVAAFSTHSKIYPHDDGFSVTEFDRCARSVVNTGIRGVEFVSASFGFEDLVEQLGADDGDSINPRYLY